jgi:spore coat assembly protein
VVSRLLKKYSPDLLVLTGHDAYLKRKGRDFSDLNNYRNSRYFVEATRAARRYEPSRDELIIFAGACQSHYEALLEAGANFASSPQRVFIHALDPVFVVKVVANTPIHAIANVSEAIASTFSGFDGIGGVESRGKLRLGLPKSPY